MCVLVFAYRVHPTYELGLAGNRDEFYARASAPAAFWKDHPNVLAGRDLEKGGTWMGVTRSGCFAALTNFRDPNSRDPSAPSRGRLVSEFLIGNDAPRPYLRALVDRGWQYNDFNLFLSDGKEFCYFSSRTQEIRALEPGIHGVSNDLLDTPWPKVTRAKRRLCEVLGDDPQDVEDRLLAILADRERPPDADLPDTGVGLEWERVLGPIFVTAPHYGTRASTVICLPREGEARLVERSFGEGGIAMSTMRYEFDLGR